LCARAAAASTLAFSPASPSFVDSPAAAGPSARWPRDRSTIKNDRNMGRKYIHHHRPRGLGVAPGVPDKILGNNMTGAVVVDKIPGPGGAGYLSTTIAPAMLWPRIVSGTPGAAPKPPRAVGVDISRPGIKYTASVKLSHPENWWFAQCLTCPSTVIVASDVRCLCNWQNQPGRQPGHHLGHRSGHRPGHQPGQEPGQEPGHQPGHSRGGNGGARDLHDLRLHVRRGGIRVGSGPGSRCP
jgi:hypothetical protein